MSTEMVGTTRHTLTRFYGGHDRGTCLQVTVRDLRGFNILQDEGWITLSKNEAHELIVALDKFIDGTLEEEDV